MSSATKKHAKLLARRRRVSDEQRRREALKRKHDFPRLVVESTEAPAELVIQVQSAVASVNFRDRELFPAWEANYYRLVKRVGFSRACEALHAAASECGVSVPDVLDYLFAHLIKVISEGIPHDALRPFLPFTSVVLSPEEDYIRVRVRSLRQAKGPGGTVYYSRHEPKLDVGGQMLTVGFSAHAIEQTYARLSLTEPSLRAMRDDVFAFFDECLDFELCQMPGGQLAFTFFEDCDVGTWRHGVAHQVLGDSLVPGRHYRLRVGYCPAVIEGRFLKAKTMLLPGFAATPEHSRLLATDLPSARRRELLHGAKGLTGQRLAEGGANILKWFHDQGVEQIRPGRVRRAA
jgi:hypothetical protein